MNSKLLLISCFCTFSVMYLLSSCSKEDNIPDPKSYFSGWGYFKGTINEKEISIENDGYKFPITSTIYKDGIDGGMPVVKGIIIGITYVNKTELTEGLAIMIHIPAKGVRYIKKTVDFECDYDGIHIRRIANRTSYYIPKKEKPFHLEITDVVYRETVPYIIEGKINGVLYRTDNPQDSISISGIFGTK